MEPAPKREYVLRISPENRAALHSCLNKTKSNACRELMGICEGLLADKEVNPSEAAYLKDWLKRHPAESGLFPFRDLIERLQIIFADGVADPDECAELSAMLTAIVGERVVHNDPRLPGAGQAGPTRAVFDMPAPTVDFENQEFCATGVFAFGGRAAVENAIVVRGGTTVKAPRASTNFVLVGSFVSPAWKNGNFGTKIMRALELRDLGKPLWIIEETHWRTFLGEAIP